MENVLQLVLVLAVAVVAITLIVAVSHLSAIRKSLEELARQAEEHGFLWRLDTYWSWEERDGGVYVQVESISLTRAIPVGLGWAIGPFVESVPRELLEFTLRAAVKSRELGNKGIGNREGVGR